MPLRSPKPPYLAGFLPQQPTPPPAKTRERTSLRRSCSVCPWTALQVSEPARTANFFNGPAFIGFPGESPDKRDAWRAEIGETLQVGKPVTIWSNFRPGYDWVSWSRTTWNYPLRCRIKALLRRVQERPTHGAVKIGALVVDPVSREVRLNDKPIEVSQKEFALLRVLVSDVTRVFTKEELVHAVWGTRSLGSSRTLDSHACRLRQKLAGSEHSYILNVWGVGYRLLDSATGSAA